MNPTAYIQQSMLDALALQQQLLESSEIQEALAELAELCIQALEAGKKILLAGNGGSAGDAQHLATELLARYECERKALPAIALTTDTSIITAVRNDFHFDQIFSRQLEALGNIGDVFIAISTSGNSSNIVNAVDCANSLGLSTVAFCGQGGKIQAAAQYALAVPSTCTARIQECHILLGHILCGLIERHFAR